MNVIVGLRGYQKKGYKWNERFYAYKRAYYEH